MLSPFFSTDDEDGDGWVATQEEKGVAAIENPPFQRLGGASLSY